VQRGGASGVAGGGVAGVAARQPRALFRTRESCMPRENPDKRAPLSAPLSSSFHFL